MSLYRGLTPRQKVVLECLSSGMRDKEIGETLGIASATVKVHVRAVLAKLEVGSRVEAALAAVRHENHQLRLEVRRLQQDLNRRV